nr:polymer-forming cytoskeletal protein [Pseudoalteromonas piscicida]
MRCGSEALVFNSFKNQRNNVPAIIAQSTKVTGDIVCEGELQLDGTVHGNLDIEKLIIGNKGLVQGNIQANELTILGKVEGDIQAKQVTLLPSAQVFGNIEHETLTIEAGAHVDGKLTHRNERANNVTAIDSADDQIINN